MLREHDLLGPLEGVGVLIVGGDEGIDLLAQLTWRGEAGTGQGPAIQDGELDFDQIEPRGVGRSEMKMDVLVAGQPAIVFGLVGIQVVEEEERRANENLLQANEGRGAHARRGTKGVVFASRAERQ